MDPLGIFPYWIDSIIWWVGLIFLIVWTIVLYLVLVGRITEIEDSDISTYEHEKSNDPRSTCSEIYQNKNTKNK